MTILLNYPGGVPCNDVLQDPADTFLSGINDSYFSINVRPAEFNSLTPISYDDLSEFNPAANSSDSTQPSPFVNDEGWLLALQNGEKVLTNAVTVDNVVQFQTYVPGELTGDECSFVADFVGETRFYAFNSLDGSASIAHFGEASGTDGSDAGDASGQQIFEASPVPYLPSNPIVYVTGGDSGEPGPIASGVGAPAVIDNNRPEPAYWYQSNVQ